MDIFFKDGITVGSDPPIRFFKFEDFISSDLKNDNIDSIANFINVNKKLFSPTLSKLNEKKKVKSNLVRDLLYKDTFLSKTAKAIIKSDSMRNHLKIFINHFNSSNFTQSESKDIVEKQLKSIPKEYLIWNNKQTELLMKTTNLNLNDWMY